jgi:hypothetical protein
MEVARKLVCALVKGFKIYLVKIYGTNHGLIAFPGLRI